METNISHIDLQPTHSRPLSIKLTFIRKHICQPYKVTQVICDQLILRETQNEFKIIFEVKNFTNFTN